MREETPPSSQGATDTHAGEEQGPKGRIDDLQDAVPDEDAKDGEDEQDHQADDQHAAAGGEVVLGLQEGRGPQGKFKGFDIQAAFPN